MEERRRSIRQKCFQRGRVYFDGGRKSVDCRAPLHGKRGRSAPDSGHTGRQWTRRLRAMKRLMHGSKPRRPETERLPRGSPSEIGSGVLIRRLQLQRPSAACANQTDPKRQAQRRRAGGRRGRSIGEVVPEVPQFDRGLLEEVGGANAHRHPAGCRTWPQTSNVPTH